MGIVIFTTKGSVLGQKIAETAYKKGLLKKMLFIKPGYKNYGILYSIFIYVKKYGFYKTFSKICEKIGQIFEKNLNPIPTKFYQDISKSSEKEIINILKGIRPDICISASYRKIIPEKVVKSQKNFLNIHPSLLPKYRGANPIYWAIKNKEELTGITYHFLTKKIDAGNIILQKKITISKDDTETSLKNKCAIEAADILQKAIHKVVRGYKGKKQKDELVTLAPDHK